MKLRNWHIILAACALSTVLVMLVQEQFGLKFKMSHFLFDYEVEFLKRGLVGQLINWTIGPLTIESAQLIADSMLIGVSLCIFLALRRIDLSVSLAVCALIYCSSVHFRNLVLDAGRLDQFGIMCGFLILAFLGTRFCLALCLFAPALIFVHEAVVIWLMPFVALVLFLEKENRKIALMGITVFAISIIVAFFGGIESSVSAYVDYLTSKTPDGNALIIPREILTRTIGDNIEWGVSHLYGSIISGKGILGIAYLLAITGLIMFIRDPSLRKLGFALPIATLCLSFLGTDFFRWISLASFAVIWVIMLACIKGCIRWECGLKSYLLSLAAASTLIGPIGIDT